ncbi:ATP-binding protein [Oceanirhabdus sp. W0125-5]|uniref:ATP-binding protein n=1 Tax=Oceanirhabdus sp. W0125-5 TaxID=2999116 RepID=UPI0022F32043|nr:ATP-binding protein [Oceanirhabdus sp. W0125-5]WBW96924.1 ATP-binding protein [Oceanirhabdus sp. W0125-5]
MELVVLSGKGGTGKTTIATALGELSRECTKVDCDVDAPNLSLFYKGTQLEKKSFFGGKKAFVNKEKCNECGMCTERCKFGAIKDGVVDIHKCEGCGVCKLVCPNDALFLKDYKNAEILAEKMKIGILTRAEMDIGSDGSGKLITALRRTAKEHSSDELIIIDGSPGIGCPVISSCTNSDYVLIVTEPTKSGISDLKRVYGVTDGFGIRSLVCINKYDINTKNTEEIKKYCQESEIEIIGLIPFDSTVNRAINELKPITEFKESIACKAIEDMWRIIKLKIKQEVK